MSAIQEGVPEVPRILIVDDDWCIREILAMKLTSAGFEVVLAENGRDGLESAVADPPDLVLLDWMMPGPSGPEICSQMREHASLAGIPVFLLTAKASDEDAQYGLTMGADGYIRKPFSPRDMVERISSVLEGGRVTPHPRAAVGSEPGQHQDAR